MNESIEVKVGKLEERVEQHHTHIRERLSETIELFAKQEALNNVNQAKTDAQINSLSKDVRIVTWTLGTIGALIGASQTGLLETIRVLLGGL